MSVHLSAGLLCLTAFKLYDSKRPLHSIFLQPPQKPNIYMKERKENSFLKLIKKLVCIGVKAETKPLQLLAVVHLILSPFQLLIVHICKNTSYSFQILKLHIFQARSIAKTSKNRSGYLGKVQLRCCSAVAHSSCVCKGQKLIFILFTFSDQQTSSFISIHAPFWQRNVCTYVNSIIHIHIFNSVIFCFTSQPQCQVTFQVLLKFSRDHNTPKTSQRKAVFLQPGQHLLLCPLNVFTSLSNQ